MKFDTQLIHAGYEQGKANGAVIPPIYATSTFYQGDIDGPQLPKYARMTNPTRESVEKTLQVLEQGDRGFLFASGMAAINAVMSLLEPGSHVVSCDDVYGGTYKLFEGIKRHNQHLDVTYHDLTDANALYGAIRPNTRLIWLETPSNPLLKIIDIAMICEIAQERNIMVGVDNTFASPYLQNPICLGADIVMHSATKYLNGHSDIIAGAVITKTKELSDRMYTIQYGEGAILSPFDCFLLSRGMKTLTVRMKQHLANTEILARYLNQHPKVEHVFFPGLESHVNHHIAKQQMRGFGAMITFCLKADMRQTIDFCQERKLFPLAVSLGGVESLMNHPFTMSHSSFSEQERLSKGITPNMIRMSVGIEDVEDLIEDLEAGLSKLPG